MYWNRPGTGTDLVRAHYHLTERYLMLRGSMLRYTSNLQCKDPCSIATYFLIIIKCSMPPPPPSLMSGILYGYLFKRGCKRLLYFLHKHVYLMFIIHVPSLQFPSIQESFFRKLLSKFVLPFFWQGIYLSGYCQFGIQGKALHWGCYGCKLPLLEGLQLGGHWEPINHNSQNGELYPTLKLVFGGSLSFRSTFDSSSEN